MCFSNMYFGLQTGWVSMMSLQASMLGFSIFKLFFPKHSSDNRPDFGPQENVFLQTVAVATATMPLAAGFVGIIPALTQLSWSEGGAILFPAWKLVVWSLGLSFIGVFFAVPLRKETIVREQLPFPSGTATAQMIEVLHEHHEQQQMEEQEQLLTLRRRQARRTTSLQPGNNNDALDHDGFELSTLHLDAPSSFFDEAEDDEEIDTVFAMHEHHQSWSIKMKAFVSSFAVSSTFTLASYFFPVLYALPVFNWLTLNRIDFRSWEWYFTPSLSYIGQGMIMGLPVTLSMLAGCIVGWGLLSPLAYFSGWAPGSIDDWQSGAKGWILWISLGIMISESIISLFVTLFKQLYTTINTKFRHAYTSIQQSNQEESLEDEFNGVKPNDKDKPIEDAPPDQQVPPYMIIFGLLASVVLCVGSVHMVFGDNVMPVSMTLLSILFALFLSILGVRALGETDLNPVSGIGKVSQVAFAAFMPGNIVANLIAGGVAEAAAQQAGDLMQDLKTGYLLHASPKAQFYGQLIGSLLSSFIATGAYLMYTSTYTIPGPQFSVPTAQVWLDMARLVNGHPLPPHVYEFIVSFAILFGLLVILKAMEDRLRWVKKWSWLFPQGIAFAVGIYNPPSFTLARVMGGITCHIWNRYCEKPNDTVIIIIASGFVLGEGTCAIVNMLLYALSVPHFS
ncbi:OPT oligopeptide transporter protein-domain-containing protein [Mycotypha africana]|uniref:OPT oligopeptide transporter protein-domain-containing protein n=1 Tax=Mycotypha africana TaxID=64632 RepID=UPI0022FFF17D|nr:OPT oligopeptide transporter protein-domain-containing protein [Mycotypha africana]KAI8971671.1 OPT oligopeptide transporter protein-domain-containing protein [Mycotypha africana]